MRFVVLRLLALFALIPSIAAAAFFDNECPQPVISGADISFETAFTPDGQPTELAARSLKAAQASIRVVAHRFISKALAVELVSAAKAGKEVQIITDKVENNGGYSNAAFFSMMNIPPHLLKGMGGQYQDYVLIDDKELLLGNIGALAEADDEKKNSASILIIHNAPELAKRYKANWQWLWNHSETVKETKK